MFLRKGKRFDIIAHNGHVFNMNWAYYLGSKLYMGRKMEYWVVLERKFDRKDIFKKVR